MKKLHCRQYRVQHRDCSCDRAEQGCNKGREMSIFTSSQTRGSRLRLKHGRQKPHLALPAGRRAPADPALPWVLSQPRRHRCQKTHLEECLSVHSHRAAQTMTAGRIHHGSSQPARNAHRLDGRGVPGLPGEPVSPDLPAAARDQLRVVRRATAGRGKEHKPRDYGAMLAETRKARVLAQEARVRVCACKPGAPSTPGSPLCPGGPESPRGPCGAAAESPLLADNGRGYLASI